MAFDFGTRRIGVAVGERALHMAHPLATISEETSDRRFAAIGALVDEWKPSLLIVGLPLYADGRAHEMTARAQRFARQLTGRFALPVKLVDERYSTREAETALREAGVRAREQRAVRDQVAAQRILQDYFDHDSASS